MKRLAIYIMTLLGVCVFTACDSENGRGDVIWDIFLYSLISSSQTIRGTTCLTPLIRVI